MIRRHFAIDRPRLKKLGDYYLNQNKIKGRVQQDSTKPNNKVANGYAGYITDTLTGYFVGKPITYICQDEGVIEYLSQIFEYNDEADENTELAKSASIYGVAYEELYVDQDGVLRFKSLPTIDCIPIYDTTIENNLLYFVRYFEEEDIVTETKHYQVEVIDAAQTRIYRTDSLMTTMNLVEEIPHYFKMVPIAIFKNNEEEIGDFERVIDLIDAYDQMESDSMNDFEYFTDCFLALYGLRAEAEDIRKMKEDRVILLEDGTKAEWLIKDNSSEAPEAMKNRLDNDIHKFSFCPNMSDEDFASNASGVAIKFKTMGTENVVSIKERKFKRGLQQRLELMSMITQILGTTFDWRSINIVFTRNLPTNDADIASVVNSLKDIVSQETLLAQIPFVDDVQEEMERIKKEREEEKETNPFFQSINSYSQMRSDENELAGNDN